MHTRDIGQNLLAFDDLHCLTVQLLVLLSWSVSLRTGIDLILIWVLLTSLKLKSAILMLKNTLVDLRIG